jgi:hypothetical protein
MFSFLFEKHKYTDGKLCGAEWWQREEYITSFLFIWSFRLQGMDRKWRRELVTGSELHGGR